MVYCGRPSTSCDNCRLKKRRCDKAVPHCGQCRRKGQECPGYRDVSSLMFRDESSQVIDKARAKKAVVPSKRTIAEATSPVPAQDGAMAGYASPGQSSMEFSSFSFTEAMNNASTASPPPPPPPMVMDGTSGANETANGDNSMSGGGGGEAGGGAGGGAGNFSFGLFGFDDTFNADMFLPTYNDYTGMGFLGSDAGSSPMSIQMDVGADPFPSLNQGLTTQNLPVSTPTWQAAENDLSTSFPEDTSAIARPFSLPLDMTALNFFLSHYVIPRSGPSSGFLDYIVTIMSTEDSNEMLESAVLAVGFAGLAHTMNQEELTKRSDLMYKRATERVKAALAKPQIAKRDSTLVTVLVLALYEFAKSSFQGWIHHMQGTGTLLALRGKAQFKTPIGIQIFKDVFPRLLTNTLRMGCAIPSGLRMIRLEAIKAIGASDPYVIATSAMVELLDLYKQISPQGYSFVKGNSSDSESETSPSASKKDPAPDMTIDDIERYLSQALELDDRLETFLADSPPDWQYASVKKPPSDPSATVFGDEYHVYHDICIADVLNSMRQSRILANHAVGHLLLKGATTDSAWFFNNNHQDRLQQLGKLMEGFRRDMIASIPQHLGYATPARALQGAPTPQPQHLAEAATPLAVDTGIKVSDTPSPSFSMPPAVQQFHAEQVVYAGSAAGGCFAAWVLLVVGCMHLNEETRAWIVSQLRQISSQCGLGQPSEFAQVIESSLLRPPLV